MGEPFKIIYDKSRFPIRQKRSDGTYGCRGCGGEIPKGRRSWCGKTCARLFDPSRVMLEVRNRDKDVCSHCGFDCEKAYSEWLDSKSRLTWIEWNNRKPPIAEYDHIVPFSEGGLTVLENIRTLCTTCHANRTYTWKKMNTRPAKAASRKIRPVVLPLSDWSALDVIARELKCMPLGGRTPDKPSVVTMLRLIARGELVVTRKVTVTQ